ncbi:MAG: 50S ribosomal protein L10 [Promethearchaeota archaeon]|nr:MAG: 50S ribosomal protein L10 [Candidatus Lokiarchaeota archaeon]
MITKEDKIPQWKKDEVDYLVRLMEEYNNIIVIKLSNIIDKQVQEMRKILRGDAVLRMSKKSLQERALDKYKKQSGKENLERLKEHIPGQSGLLFTDMDPFELKKLFSENMWMVAAKPGTVAPKDIVVPAGDTGLPTGQVISELNMVLKLPTMLKNDTIHIREDTVTHEKGDTISTKEASILKKLGVEPIESLLEIEVAWSDGRIIPNEVIYMDMEEFKQEIAESFNTAKVLAIELGIIDEETLEPLLQKAHREALALLFEMPILDANYIDDYIKRATMEANSINATILGEGTVPKSEPKKQKTEKKEKKKEPEEEEDEPTGLGTLF